MKKKVKGLYEKVMANKLLSALILMVVLSIGGDVLKWTKDTTKNLFNAPEAVHELQEDVNNLQERVTRLEKFIRPTLQKRK